MVGHQYIGVQPTVIAPERLAKITEIALAILITMEAWLAVVTALDDVLGDTNKLKTGFARHGYLPVAKTRVQTTEACTAVVILAKTVF